MPKVFISYSHDTAEHKQWVLQACEQLRADGLECQVDQYVHGFPAEGWPSWMEKQIERADFVLIVCSELYLQRFRREDPNGGRGVAFEGAIITQTLYDHYCHNKKFIPVIPAGGNLDHVPLTLKSFTAYRLPGDYISLYRLLTNQPAVVPTSIGTIKVMPPENSPSGTAIAPPPKLAPPSSVTSASYDPHNPAFLVPFRQKGKYMVGRQDALRKVREQLLEGKPTSIGQTALFKGIGGLGKTQLAVEYAYHYRDAYPNGVYWITADENIDAQLTQIAVAAHWVAPASEHATKLDIARHRIRSYSDCLIVFDNLESTDAIRAYLPEPSASPHILVTSRSEQPEFTDIKLELLDDTHSYVMLVQQATRDPVTQEEEAAAHEIGVALGGLPLALELAGAYLENRPIGWCAYRDLLRENLQQALPTKLASLTKHEADLFKTLTISEKEIGVEPLLAQILDLLTWSGSSPMGLSLMADLLDVQPVQLHGALSLGVALRLLQQAPNDRHAIHRLVQEVRRRDRPLTQRRDWVSTITKRMGNWFEAIRTDFRKLPIYELEFEHLRVWHTHAGYASPIESIRLLWLQAYPAHHRGRHDEAMRIVQAAIEALRTHSLADTHLTAHLYNDLASCNSRLGNYSHALELALRALEIQRDLFGDKHPDIALSFSNLAFYYGVLGNHQLALDLGHKALKMQQELFGNTDPNIARSLSNLSGYYSSIGNRQLALSLAQQALDMRHELFGDKHPDIACSLNNLAMDYASSGDYKHALELNQQALEMRREFFGDKHPDVAHSLNSLARIYLRLGNPRALELGQRALEIRRETLGPAHPNTIKSVRFVAERLLANPLTAKRGSSLIDEYLRVLPRDLDAREELLDLLNSRKGFRNPPRFGQGKRQKKRR